jgi:hypothetical protein
MFNMRSSFARKNPLAAIRAFSRAFGNDLGARLIVKLSNPAAYPPGAAAVMEVVRAPNIEVIDRTLCYDELANLYQASDMLVSLHRSEISTAMRI